uniref:ATP-binding protein n=1 Tax=Nitrosomonas supralitoralis TaxID=2116706 RepID=UPI0035A846DA
MENFICKVIPDQLEILLENIITNAIIYSHENTSIEISSLIDRKNLHASITITDHGIGIEEKDLPNIFNEYFYSPRAALHNKATSGIGLSIVKIAAENNRLKIRIASEPGVGTTFTIIFGTIKRPIATGSAKSIPLTDANFS